jgi:hypothetical protein
VSVSWLRRAGLVVARLEEGREDPLAVDLREPERRRAASSSSVGMSDRVRQS